MTVSIEVRDNENCIGRAKCSPGNVYSLDFTILGRQNLAAITEILIILQCFQCKTKSFSSVYIKSVEVWDPECQEYTDCSELITQYDSSECEICHIKSLAEGSDL
jgi:hypothetical protein